MMELKMTLKEVAEELGLSYKQTCRITKRYCEKGIQGLISRKRGKFREEVSSFHPNIEKEGLNKLIIPGQKYVKFTTNPDPMPDVIVKAWNAIWNMSPKQLGGKRSYQTDFEIYDERAQDEQKIILDLYIGIE